MKIVSREPAAGANAPELTERKGNIPQWLNHTWQQKYEQQTV